ncbi:MAG: hypothetical protein RJB38_1336 [Pseudomonadota bacterium]|jgi:hypothetical protein
MKLLPFTFLVIALNANAAPKVPATVRLDFLEALAPRDTTSSEEFRRQFESSVALGVKLTEANLKECGYRLETHTQFYSASDTLQARERAMDADKSETWLVVGPRRSDHYLLVANGAPDVPSVSLMAAASEIEKLGALHLSVYATNSSMAPALANVAKASLKARQKPNYLTVVSDDCLVCKDFSQLFDSASKARGLQKLDEVKVITETPDTTPVVESVLKHKPTFILLPNFSKISAQIMASIQSRFPSALFLGGDGWGDGQFGFVDRNPSLTTASGLTVRGFPPVDAGLSNFPLGKLALDGGSRGEFVPKSGPGMAILRIIQGTKDILCSAKPKDRAAFRKAFAEKGRFFFSAPWGVSAYRLENARITYWKEAKGTSKKRVSQ